MQQRHSEVRDFTYASYPGAGSSVISRDGFFKYDSDSLTAGGVCAYDSRAETPSANAPREVHGASCETCNSDLECTGNAKWCKLAGKVCVAPDDVDGSHCETPPLPLDTDKEHDTCLDPIFAPDLTFNLTFCTNDLDCTDPETCLPAGYCSTPEQSTDALYRCQTNSDCPPGLSLKCTRNVWIPCNTCVTATWKLKATSAGVLTGLFDLASNPEEEERLNFLRRNCNIVKPITTNTSQSAAPLGIAGVIDALEGATAAEDDPSRGNLTGWLSCVGNDCSTPY